MKKVLVVSKTHLDLGFTDYAGAVRENYIHKFIPSAVALAQRVNTPEKKSFVWTTGSWILNEALRFGSGEQKEKLRAALERGDIVPHAMPFTLHTELLDGDTLDYGLSMVEKLDVLRGRKTTAAKMTDVPGHTVGLVKHLARHGVKLLHIGVNGASALADVPPCFLWRSGEDEVVVIYSGDYGGAFQSSITEEILYFDHTLDNRGAPDEAQVIKKLKAIEQQYPGYVAEAGCMDDFADILWEKRAQLPVLTDEIGDTWIHGSAADPYKSAALRQLVRLKNSWLQNGTLHRESAEYDALAQALLCTAEHTCGMDTKTFFGDYENYLKRDFQKARQADTVKLRHPLRDFPLNFLILWNRRFGGYRQGSYRAVEQSWLEQRGYITAALEALSAEHRAQAQAALFRLRPQTPALKGEAVSGTLPTLRFGAWELKINAAGGIQELTNRGGAVVRANDEPCMEYRSYSEKDYDFWRGHYLRNLKTTYAWAAGDFLRPLLRYAAGKYPTGRFFYRAAWASPVTCTKEAARVTVGLCCDPALCSELGAPRGVEVDYCLAGEGLTMTVRWFQKDANRLTEAILLHLFPACGEMALQKVDTAVNPYAVVSGGGRKLHAVWGAQFEAAGTAYQIENLHAPLFAPGKGKLLEFDNQMESIRKDGISYILYDNVWGTNFPLWYEENASFTFRITEKK